MREVAVSVSVPTPSATYSTARRLSPSEYSVLRCWRYIIDANQNRVPRNTRVTAWIATLAAVTPPDSVPTIAASASTIKTLRTVEFKLALAYRDDVLPWGRHRSGRSQAPAS